MLTCHLLRNTHYLFTPFRHSTGPLFIRADSSGVRLPPGDGTFSCLYLSHGMRRSSRPWVAFTEIFIRFPMKLLLGPQHSSMGIGDLVSSFRSGTRISPARNPVHPVAPGGGGTGMLICGTFHRCSCPRYCFSSSL